MRISSFLIALFLGSAGFSYAASVLACPTETLTIAGIAVALPATVQNLNGICSYQSTPGISLVATSAYAVTSASYDAYSDPFIDYGFSFTNLGPTTTTFAFTITEPFIGGPYTVLTDSFSDTVTDSGLTPNGSVTIGLVPGTSFVSQPFLNGGNVDGINPGCTKTGSPGFSGPGCVASNTLSTTTVTTAATGTFGVNVDFTLTPGDIYSFSGRVALANATPEPSTTALLGSALIGVCFFLQRRKET